MTTIVWRGGVLAADRQANSDGIKSKATKIFESPEWAIAFSGHVSNGTLFISWFVEGKTGDCPLDENTCALVMNMKTGKCWEWAHPGVGMPVEEKFSAMGSGAAVAYGALEMGADAKKAVQVACKRDINSGFGVQTVEAKRS